MSFFSSLSSIPTDARSCSSAVSALLPISGVDAWAKAPQAVIFTLPFSVSSRTKETPVFCSVSSAQVFRSSFAMPASSAYALPGTTFSLVPACKDTRRTPVVPASDVFSKWPRMPPFSSAYMPSIVVPPGEHTASFNLPGCSPVSSTILAAPTSV